MVFPKNSNSWMRPPRIQTNSGDKRRKPHIAPDELSLLPLLHLMRQSREHTLTGEVLEENVGSITLIEESDEGEGSEQTYD